MCSWTRILASIDAVLGNLRSICHPHVGGALPEVSDEFAAAVRILYGGASLYIGAMLYDAEDEALQEGVGRKSHPKEIGRAQWRPEPGQPRLQPLRDDRGTRWRVVRRCGPRRWP